MIDIQEFMIDIPVIQSKLCFYFIQQTLVSTTLETVTNTRQKHSKILSILGLNDKYLL